MDWSEEEATLPRGESVKRATEEQEPATVAMGIQEEGEPVVTMVMDINY